MQPPVTQQQANHVNEQTAYYVNNYPYCFGKFCTIRYWVETKKAWGQRLMTQIQDPLTGQWFKAKTDGYFDVAIITTVVNPGFPNHGWVVPVQIKLDQFDLATLNVFATYYTFTPHQKAAIMEALKAHSIHFAPKWVSNVELNFGLLEKAENPIRFLGERKTNEQGIAIESQHDADKRVKREKRSNWPSAQAPKAASDRIMIGDVDVTDMSPEQRAVMLDLLTPEEE